MVGLLRLDARLKLDGWNVLPALRGEPGKVCTRRFWQWNRYTPVLECNAAMRDGAWKLVRPVIHEAMNLPKDECDRDMASKRNPETRTTICRDPEPERTIPPAPPAQLFDIESDPYEKHDLAAAEPDRVARMLRELETWFEAVEADRRTIDDTW